MEQSANLSSVYVMHILRLVFRKQKLLKKALGSVLQRKITGVKCV